MRYCGLDEVVFRRALAGSDEMVRALVENFLAHPQNRDFRPVFGSTPEITTNGNGGQVAIQEPITTMGKVVRCPCEETHTLLEKPRFVRYSDGSKPCFFGNHKMPPDMPLYVAKAVIDDTGREVDLFGCEECAKKLMVAIIHEHVSV